MGAPMSTRGKAFSLEKRVLKRLKKGQAGKVGGVAADGYVRADHQENLYKGQRTATENRSAFKVRVSESWASEVGN